MVIQNGETLIGKNATPLKYSASKMHPSNVVVEGGSQPDLCSWCGLCKRVLLTKTGYVNHCKNQVGKNQKQDNYANLSSHWAVNTYVSFKQAQLIRIFTCWFTRNLEEIHIKSAQLK